MASAGCVGCGTPLVGDYCHVCGERRSAGPPTIGRFLREAGRDLLNAEGRVPATFRALVERPGTLTRDYMAGRRRPWLSPLQVFLLANLLFFITLSFTGMQGLTAPLRMQLYNQSYSETAREAVRERFLAMDSVDYAVFEARFDYASEQQAKSLVILLVPLFAVATWLTRWWQRGQGARHLVFAVHYLSVVMVLLVVMGALVRILQLAALVGESVGARALGAPARLLSEQVFTLAVLAVLAAYLFFALRTAYGDGRLAAGVRAIGLAAVTVLLIVFYRLILFFTVLYTV